MYNLTYHNVSNITEQSYFCTTLADNYILLNRRQKDILLYVNVVIAIMNLFANTLTIYAITITKQYKNTVNQIDTIPQHLRFVYRISITAIVCLSNDQ